MPDYPTREQHDKAWASLAQAIACAAGVAECNGAPGRLTVIGSGIQSLGFTLGDRELIERADEVFFCVADPATVVWLKRLRPDAYDLYVLYDDSKTRFATYVQMTEAMLHYVRRGRHVVAVYYGHPGIFVLSTHRAIAIARREGHRATMRAAVSALDCLCADLGIDPAHPGMQTHEATDLLVRRRVPDPTLHVVLWQVGLIGEMGFRRQGYRNRSFSTFVEYLQEHYGAAYPVVHYVGSRYPTIQPLIAEIRLDELHDPAIQADVTGISTFYLPPRDAVPADPGVVASLGLLGPGQTVREPQDPLREIAAYDVRATRAVEALSDFEVPQGYHWQQDTPASRFLIELRLDQALQDLYERRPDEALDHARFADMAPEERSLLRTRDAGAVQIAAKGTYRRRTSNEAWLRPLLRDRRTASKILEQHRDSPGAGRLTVEAWAGALGHDVTWRDLQRDVQHLNRRYLLAWTGVYVDPRRDLTLTIVGNSGDNDRSLVFLGDRRLTPFEHHKGTLTWKPGSGTSLSGFLRLEVDADGRRRVHGAIWPEGGRAANHEVSLHPVDPDRGRLAPIAATFASDPESACPPGTYSLRCPGIGHRPGIGHGRPHALELGESGLSVDGSPARVDEARMGRLRWSEGPAPLQAGRVTFLKDPLTGLTELFGQVDGQLGPSPCHGAATSGELRPPADTTIPPAVLADLIRIVDSTSVGGGILLWQKWEKHSFTSSVINRVLTRMNRE